MIKFAVMSDLHADTMHDSRERVKIFTEAANAANCDFAIQLGDFIQPDFTGTYTCSESRVSAVMKNCLAGKGLSKEEKKQIFSELDKLNCPLYHVLGNHDLDLYTKQEVMSYWGMSRPYYSFDIKNYHFIVLDANFGCENGRAIEFDRGNYMKWFFQKVEPFPYIPEEQLDWLREDLNKTDKASVIFCHEGINGGFLNAINHEEIFRVLKNAPHKVQLCLCGHKHEDLLESEDDIPVYYVNSMTGYAAPPKYSCHRFTDEIEKRYPNVQYMCPYEKALFVIVSIDDHKITIKGRTSQFVTPGPKELAMSFGNGKVTFSAKSSDAEIVI